ncbi:SDR family NAD(P)-dependent oxidoreductase [Rubrobacter tropicus]|uniref:SDR family NAD(P)-dependent oxidoreductase n=1 Tax=Rubrobacter tropicus TaxID=2653851 RepID=A0A6G8QBU3_9ACTN|nr:SDR family NAD(P)-dependent oxidoreductase [Rubrobacter tropicus]QIN83747.1 SDR family NAD(P)-dependent oxidoreductase [Rubrobacter tropicus]
MTTQESIAITDLEGRAAVITGGAKGIGLAIAARLASLGMKLCLADTDAGALEMARETLAPLVAGPEDLRVEVVDVSSLEEVRRLKDVAYGAFGEVALLVNNAGIESSGMKPWDGPEAWDRILDVNLMGVVHGVQAFTEAMISQDAPGAIVNVGSKEGITTPPGNAAYSVSKAGVKVLTEQLAHELRQIDGCRVSAHLLVPGFTFTSLTARGRTEKPEDAWTPDQVAEFMLEGMSRGDFYILCPDNSVSREMDERRIRWAAEDLIKNRPALSRWHPDHEEPFATYMQNVKKP